MACRETGAGRSWKWAIIETSPAWRRAYLGLPDGGLEHFSLDSLLDDDGGERTDRHDPGGF